MSKTPLETAVASVSVPQASLKQIGLKTAALRKREYIRTLEQLETAVRMNATPASLKQILDNLDAVRAL